VCASAPIVTDAAPSFRSNHISAGVAQKFRPNIACRCLSRWNDCDVGYGSVERCYRLSYMYCALDVVALANVLLLCKLLNKNNAKYQYDRHCFCASCKASYVNVLGLGALNRIFSSLRVCLNDCV
jgi:hypothetical protein